LINAIVVIPSLPKDRRITNNDYQPTILLGDRIFPEIQMSQSPVTNSLEIILTNITEKLDSLQKDFTDLKVDMAE